MTTDYVNAHLATRKDGVSTVPTMVCKDGVSFSVQASRHHYCSPRADTGPYTAVEVVLLNKRAKVKGWGKPDQDYQGGLWSWLSVDKVNAEIARRGGLVS